MKNFKVVHVISDLSRGGAQTQLSHIAENDDATVISLRPLGEVANDLLGKGVVVYSCASSFGPFGIMINLILLLKKIKPDLVCGWMYHGNLVVALASYFLKDTPFLWNIRHSLHDIRREKKTTALVIKLGSTISGYAEAIIYNSFTSREQHERLGYSPLNSTVIANGFDLDRYSFNPVYRKNFRSTIGVNDSELLIGLVGRNHPMKNYEGFLKAFSEVQALHKDIQVVIIGRNLEALNALVDRLSLTNVTLHPESSRLEEVYPGLDLLVQASLWGEAFPNVVGEAMACCVPCLVTDVGDAVELVGETGFVVPSGNSEVLAEGLMRALKARSKFSTLGRAARVRMQKFYPKSLALSRYDDLYMKTLGSCIK